MAPMALPLELPTSPDFSAQLQRVEALHQKLKAEAARSQDFLAKLKRGDEIHTQSQTQAGSQSKLAIDDELQPHKTVSRHGDMLEAVGNFAEEYTKNAIHSNKESVCRCQHHQVKNMTEKEKRFAEEYRKKMPPASSFPPLPPQVDEREVRDLEKRVRGLEGRVRGFEGMPPDREMALLEVERLRRELEGLARRREGLFGLMDEKSKTALMKNKAETNKGAANPNGKVNGKVNGKMDGKKG